MTPLWNSVIALAGPRKGARSFVQQQLEQLGDTSAQLRLKFALHLLYATGLRLSEMVAAKVDDLICSQCGL
jgi:site-specific recombinase XerD